MKISANSIKIGAVLVHKDQLWVVAKPPEHTKPGKGGAYVQVEMKNIKTGIKLNERFSSTDNVEKAFLETKDCQYLYEEDGRLVFMDNENYEQIMVNKEFVGSQLPFLADSMIVKVEFFGAEPITIELPNHVTLEVVETDPVIKGATATSSYKPAILENGVRVSVPPYLVTGEKIVVRTSDSTFVERAK